MRTIFLLAFLLCSSMLYSADSIPRIIPKGDTAVGVNVTLESVYLRGMAGEYVYNGCARTSQLQWLIEPAIYIGSTMHLTLFNRVIISAGYWSATNKKTGDMTDTDWNESGAQTRQSHHECIIQMADIMDISLSLKAADLPFATVLVFVGYKLQSIAIEAGNGYVVYTSSDQRIPISGRFVNYEQRFSFPYIGFAFYLPLSSGLYFTPYFSISPFVTCKVEDVHYSTGLNYYDSFTNGWYYYAGGALSLQSDRIIIRIHAGYTKIPEFRGDTYTINKFTRERTDTFKNAAATEYYSYEIGLSIGILIE